LREWSRPGVFEAAEAMAVHLIDGILRVASENGIPLQAGNAGTMFGFFFTDQKVVDYTSAKTSDTSQYAKLFHAMLERGIYLAPSQFEAAFMSSAHEEGVIKETLEAFEAAMAGLTVSVP